MKLRDTQDCASLRTTSAAVARHLLNHVAHGRTGSGAGTQSLLANALRLLIGVGTGIITARLLAPQGRGELAALIAWPAAAAGIVTMGIPGSLVYWLRVTPNASRSLIGTALAASLAFGFVATGCGALLLPHLIRHEPGWVVRDAQTLMLFALTGIAGLTALAILQGLGDFPRANLFALAAPTLSIILLGGLAVSGTLTPLSAALVTLGAGFLPFAIALLRLHRHRMMSLEDFKANLRRLLSFGLRSWPLDLLGTLGVALDQAIVTALLGPVALGYYVVALRGARVINILQTSAQPVLFVRATGTDPDMVRDTVGYATRLIASAMVLAALILGTFASILVRLLYGGAFLPAVIPLQLLLAEAILTSTAWMLAQAFFALNRPGIVSLVQLPALFSLVGLLLWLTPLYGVIGAGMALMISGALRALLVVVAFPLVLRVSPPRLLLTKGDLRRVKSSFTATSDESSDT